MWHSDYCGLNADDETSNFNKTRSFAFSDSSVFESHTVATIRKAPENNLTSAPKILSQFVPNVGLTVVVDQTLIIYEEGFAKTIITWIGEENITCFSVDPSSQFLFVGLGNACLSCIHISTGISVFERDLPNDLDSDKILKITHDHDDTSVLVFTANGHIYRFTKIDLPLFGEICTVQAGNEDALDKASEPIEIHALFSLARTSRPSDPISCTALLEDQRAIVLATTSCLHVLGFTPSHALAQVDSVQLDLKILKMEPIHELEMILCLTDTAELVLVCQLTWTVQKCDVGHVNDFTIVTDLSESHEYCVLISTSVPEVMLMTLPGLNIKWSLNDNKQAMYSVIKNETVLEDGIVYIENQTPGTSDSVDQVLIKAMVKSRPEDRLERMLRRGKFEAAYEFAQLLNLDIEIIHKARIHRIMSDLQTITWSKSEAQDSERIQNLFTTLLESLEGLGDIEFITLCCVKTLPPDISMIKTLLVYAKKRLGSVDIKASSPGLQQSIVELNTSLTRLKTYHAIHAAQDYDIETWLKFSKANLLDEVMEFLKQGKIDTVITLWLRHRSEIAETLDRNKPKLLDLIHKEVNIPELTRLLQVIIEELLSCSEHHLKYLVAWTYEKTRSLELRCGPSWCEVSLKFCEAVLSIIQSAFQYGSSLSSALACSPNSPIQSLLSLIKILQSLTLLKNSFNIRLSFAEYCQSNKLEVVFDILDRTASAQIPNLFSAFLSQYLFENVKESNDAVLTEYIKLLLESSVNWWHSEDAGWEDKISVLLPLVVNTEMRVEFILCVLRRSPVPWSPTVLSLGEVGKRALKASHQLVTAVQTEFNLVPGKLILKKYGFKQDLPPKQCLSRLIRFIYNQKNCTTAQLDDAVQLVKSLDSSKNTDPYEHYVSKLLDAGKTDEAMNFLDDLAHMPTIVTACCKAIIRLTALLVNSRNSRAETYVNILESIKQRLENLNKRRKKRVDPLVKGLDTFVQKLKHVYVLDRELSTSSSVSELSYPGIRETTLRIVLEKLNEAMSSEVPSEVTLKKIASCCGVTYEETLIALIQTTSHELYGILSQFLLNAHSVDSEAIAGKLLGVTSFLLCYYNPRKQPQLRDSLLPYVCQLSQLMLTYIHPSLLIKATELHQWVQLFKKQNLETSLSEVTVHNFITTLLNFYRYFLCHRGCDTSLCVSETTILSEADQVKLSVNLALQKLRTEQPHDLVNLRVLTIFSSALSTVVSSASLFPDIPELMHLCIKRLIRKVFSARSLDTKLGVALLSNFTQTEALATLHEAEKKYEADMLPLLHVSCLGMEYAAAHSMVSTYVHFQRLNVKCVWGNRISEFGISYKDAFRDSSDDRKKLVQRLSSDPNMKVSMLLDFCHDVQVNTQECLLYFLQQSLLGWKPVFEVKSDLDGKKELVILNDVQHVRAVCEDILCLVKDMKHLQDILVKILDKLNWYNYEIHHLICDLLQSLAARTKSPPMTHVYKMVHVLVFLSSYMRVSAPQELERNLWTSFHRDVENLPDIAAYRLPFPTRNIDFWKVLKPELNMCTYLVWYDVVDHLGLDKNTLCVVAINQMAQDDILPPASKDEWCLHPNFTSLLASIQDCVDKISSPEMVTAALYYVVNQLPPGADQVSAVQLCYHRACEWYRTDKSEDAKARLIKVKKKYLSVLTTHTLHRAGLGKKEYLKWVLSPQTLIPSLYNDKSVLLFHKSPRSSLPDINSIADRVAEIHGVDLAKARQELLGEWLSCKSTPLDTSLGDMTTVHTTVALNPCQDENFLRACYILQRDNQYSSFLLSRAFPQTDSQPTSVRLRALQCLFVIHSYESLVQMTGRGDLKYYLEDLHFVMELENLGFFYSMEEFQSWTKADLIKYLISKSSPHCTRLAFKLILHYQVKEAVLINQILSQMMLYNMVDELVTFLPKISDMNHLLSESQISDMWNSIVDTLLSKCHPNMEKFESEFERTVCTIISCPQVDYLDMTNIEQHLTRLNRPQAMTRIQSLAGGL